MQLCILLHTTSFTVVRESTGEFKELVEMVVWAGTIGAQFHSGTLQLAVTTRLASTPKKVLLGIDLGSPSPISTKSQATHPNLERKRPPAVT